MAHGRMDWDPNEKDRDFVWITTLEETGIEKNVYSSTGLAHTLMDYSRSLDRFLKLMKKDLGLG
jgi:hypothetical protein